MYLEQNTDIDATYSSVEQRIKFKKGPFLSTLQETVLFSKVACISSLKTHGWFLLFLITIGNPSKYRRKKCRFPIIDSQSVIHSITLILIGWLPSQCCCETNQMNCVYLLIHGDILFFFINLSIWWIWIWLIG